MCSQPDCCVFCVAQSQLFIKCKSKLLSFFIYLLHCLSFVDLLIMMQSHRKLGCLTVQLCLYFYEHRKIIWVKHSTNINASESLIYNISWHKLICNEFSLDRYVSIRPSITLCISQSDRRIVILKIHTRCTYTNDKEILIYNIKNHPTITIPFLPIKFADLITGFLQ
jgi:hypothetical protein